MRERKNYPAGLVFEIVMKEEGVVLVPMPKIANLKAAGKPS